jgi:hypothetical protein
MPKNIQEAVAMRRDVVTKKLAICGTVFVQVKIQHPQQPYGLDFYASLVSCT